MIYQSQSEESSQQETFKKCQKKKTTTWRNRQNENIAALKPSPFLLPQHQMFGLDTVQIHKDLQTNNESKLNDNQESKQNKLQKVVQKEDDYDLVFKNDFQEEQDNQPVVNKQESTSKRIEVDIQADQQFCSNRQNLDLTKRIAKQNTLMQTFAKQTNLHIKRRLFFTKCESTQQFEIIRFKQKLATVFFLYAIQNKERIFLCATQKQVNLTFSEFEISLNRDFLTDVKGSQLYAGHIISNFKRDRYYFFQNPSVEELDPSKSAGWLQIQNSLFGPVSQSLIYKRSLKEGDELRLMSTPLTQKEKFDMKHGWNVIQSKKNVIMKLPGSKQGISRSILLLGRNSDTKLTMVLSKELTSFQAFCFAVSHLSSSQ